MEYKIFIITTKKYPDTKYLLIVIRHNTKYSIFFPIKIKGNCLLLSHKLKRKEKRKKTRFFVITIISNITHLY